MLLKNQISLLLISKNQISLLNNERNEVLLKEYFSVDLETQSGMFQKPNEVDVISFLQTE